MIFGALEAIWPLKTRDILNLGILKPFMLFIPFDPQLPQDNVIITVQRLGERQQRGLSEERGDFPMLRPWATAHFGQPSVGKVDFRLLVCRREWVQCGLRCVVMREGCDELLIGSSQVARGVKERLGAGEALS